MNKFKRDPDIEKEPVLVVSFRIRQHILGVFVPAFVMVFAPRRCRQPLSSCVCSTLQNSKESRNTLIPLPPTIKLLVSPILLLAIKRCAIISLSDMSRNGIKM